MSSRKTFLFFFVLFTISKTIAQTNEQLLKVVPPSPNVASLGKYGEVPVSLYTGIPDISVPIFEIKDGTLDLPINLSYHAGGVRVEEVASSVGLGWTLNAGGIIGRNVRGLPDEVDPWQQPLADRVGTIQSTPNRINKLVKDVQSGDVDGEADMYYFNFNGYSGKFIYDQGGIVHVLPNKNLIIEPVMYGWKMVTEDGTVYYFTKSESVSSASCSDFQTVTSAWYLTRISSSDGKREITFTYEPAAYTYMTLLGQTKYFSTNGTGSLCLSSPRFCRGTQNYNTHRLLRIDFSQGFIKFNYNNVRADLVDDKSLDEIEIHSTNGITRTFALLYNYFGNNTDGINRPTEYSKRLKLVSLTEKSSSLAKPPYVFEYNESISLPDRLSYAQDYWGYFNGASGNPDLIPSFTTVLNTGVTVNVPGANRKTNVATAQAGILKKIRYPTGGETIFTYESNSVSDEQVESSYNEIYISLSARDRVFDLPSPFESSTFTIPPGGARVTLNVSGLASPMWAGCDFVQCQVIKDNNPTPYTFLQDGLNGPEERRWPAGTYKLRLMADCMMDSRADFSAVVTAYIPVTDTIRTRPVGGLRIKQIENTPGTGGVPVIKNYRYPSELDPAKSSGVLVNFPDYGYDLGVQSNEVDDHGNPMSPVNICSYRVRQSFSNYPLATTQGSYVGYSHVIEDLGENGQSWHSFEVTAGSPAEFFPFAPLDDFDWRRGFELGVKDFVRKNDQLIPVREIVNTPFSFTGPRVTGIKTGIDFMFLTGGAMRPELQPLPRYAFYTTTTEFFTLGETVEKIFDQNDPSRFSETVTRYTYSPEHLQLVQSAVTTSRSNQTTKEEIVTIKKYPFDYTFTGTPLGSEAQGIKNLQALHVVSAVVEQYTVKQERDVANNHLSNQHVLAGSIATYKSDKPYPDQLLKLELRSPVPLTEYGNGSVINANTFVKNSNVDINKSYKTGIIFNSYDDKGNVTTQQKAGDTRISYIWDYNSRQPIAEVLNATAAEIAYTSFEADGSGSWNINSQGIITGSSITGRKHYNLSSGSISKVLPGTAGSYVLSYWRKGGSAMIIGSTVTSKAGKTVGGWTYQEHEILAGSATITLSGSALIDELRLYPKGAQMTTYTFDPLVGITSQADINNNTTHYEYDAFLRLKTVRNDERNITKRFDYGYDAPPVMSAAVLNKVLDDYRQVDLAGASFVLRDFNYTRFEDTRQTFADGVARLPDGYRDGPPVFYNSIEMKLRGSLFCFLEQGYSIEYRVKMPTISTNNSKNVYYITNGTVNAQFIDLYGTSIDGVSLYGFGDEFGNNYGAANGGTGFDYIRVDLTHGFNNFQNIKLKVTPSKYSVFYNGIVVKEFDRDPAKPISTSFDGAMAFIGNDASFDWFKVYDKNDVVQYVEDFNTPNKPAMPLAGTMCPPPADCKVRFITYFNDVSGTNYSYDDINAMYIQATGQGLTLCN